MDEEFMINKNEDKEILALVQTVLFIDKNGKKQCDSELVYYAPARMCEGCQILDVVCAASESELFFERLRKGEA